MIDVALEPLMFSHSHLSTFLASFARILLRPVFEDDWILRGSADLNQGYFVSDTRKERLAPKFRGLCTVTSGDNCPVSLGTSLMMNT